VLGGFALSKQVVTELSSLMVKTEMALETLGYSTFNHLKRLPDEECFAGLIRRESCRFLLPGLRM
jgi:hypothetical protein